MLCEQSRKIKIFILSSLIPSLYPLQYSWASLVSQTVKKPPAMQETWVGKIPWRRKWQPNSVFLPGEFHGQRSLVGYSPWGCKESDMTERLILSLGSLPRPIPRTEALTVSTLGHLAPLLASTLVLLCTVTLALSSVSSIRQVVP